MHRWVRGREAELLGPLAEPVCCHPPNFSSPLARRREERLGGSGGGGGGGSGSLSAARMRPAGGRSPSPGSARGAASSLGVRPLESRRASAPPWPPGPRALASARRPRRGGARLQLRAPAPGVRRFAGTLETWEPPLMREALAPRLIQLHVHPQPALFYPALQANV